MNKNGLSDLSALALAPIFEKRTGMNISKLKLDDNNFTTKAGEYIGEALCNNPGYTLKKISFGGIALESIGLVRIVEACNLNKNIKKLNIGILTDDGLATLANLMKENTSLEELEMEETKNHQKYWTNVGRAAFNDTLKHHTVLKKVDCKFTKDDEPSNDIFKSEIKFYTKMKSKAQKKKDQYKDT